MKDMKRDEIDGVCAKLLAEYNRTPKSASLLEDCTPAAGGKKSFRTPCPALERTVAPASGAPHGRWRILSRWPTREGDDVLIVAEREPRSEGTNFRLWAVLDSEFNGSTPPPSPLVATMTWTNRSDLAGKARLERFITWCNRHLPNPDALALGDRRRPTPDRCSHRRGPRAAE